MENIKKHELRFKEEVISSFEFLINDNNFYLKKADEKCVRYESNKVYVEIWFDSYSFEIDFIVGRFEDMVGQKQQYVILGEILQFQGVKEQEGYTFFQASTKEAMKKVISKLAIFVQKYCLLALQGEPSFYEKIWKQRLNKPIGKEELRWVRSGANEAWQQRNYEFVIEAYESIKEYLNPGELQKLEYCKKKIAEENKNK